MTSDDGNTEPVSRWAALFTNLRSWLILLFFVVVLGGSWIAGSRLSGGADAPELKVGTRAGFFAPDFTLPALDGALVSLSGQRGNVALINLWASWCGPCRAEMQAINTMYLKYRNAGFVVLAVNATSQDNENTARSYVRNQGLTFPVLLDRDGFVSGSYRLRSLPTSYFVGRDGVISEVVVGAMSEAGLESRVQRLLAGGR